MVGRQDGHHRNRDQLARVELGSRRLILQTDEPKIDFSLPQSGNLLAW
jgi:hypothetical protein